MVSKKKFSSPSLVIIGEVINLHKQFKWFQENAETGSIFKDIIAE